MTKTSLRFRLFGIPKTLDEFVEGVKAKGLSSADIVVEETTCGDCVGPGFNFVYQTVVSSGRTRFIINKYQASTPVTYTTDTGDMLRKWIRLAKDAAVDKARVSASYLESKGIKTTFSGERLRGYIPRQPNQQI